MTDELVVAGHTLHCDEIISYLLSGLGYDYDSFVTTITARTDPVTLEEVYALLLTTESRLLHNNSPIVQPTVHVATRQPSSSSYRGRNSYRGRGWNYKEVSFYNGSNGRNTFHRDTMIFQVCDKPGHSAKKCYHRFDVTYRDNAAKSSNLHGLMATTSAVSATDWYPDTGVTYHLTNNMANLNLRSEDYTSSDQVLVGNGAGLQISQISSSILTPSKTLFVLKQLLLVPEIQKNLISVQQFCNDNLVFFEFHDRFFLINDYSGKILHRGTLKMVCIHSPACQTHSLLMHSLLYELLTKLIWHNRLGHVSFSVLQKSIFAFTLFVANKRLPVCSDCQLARRSQLSFKISNHKSINPLDKVHTDVWGPAPILSNNGARYYLCFLDDCTKFIWLFSLKLKSNIEKVFLLFKTSVERQFNRTIKNIQSDWGGEHHRMSTLLTQIGIHHRRACSYTHQQMGAVERRHKQIVEVGLSLLSHSKLPQQF